MVFHQVLRKNLVDQSVAPHIVPAHILALQQAPKLKFTKRSVQLQKETSTIARVPAVVQYALQKRSTKTETNREPPQKPELASVLTFVPLLR